MINGQWWIYAVYFFLVFFQICKYGSRNEKVAQFRDARTITTIGGENIEAKTIENKSWQHVSPLDFTGRRTAFYFCFAPIIDELWALPPFLSAASRRRRVDVIRHCLPLCLRSRERSHSYSATQSSFSCASAAIEPLIKEPTEGFLLAR